MRILWLVFFTFIVFNSAVAASGDADQYFHPEYDRNSWSILYHCGQVAKVIPYSPSSMIQYSLRDIHYGEVKVRFNYAEAIKLQIENMKKNDKTITNSKPHASGEGSTTVIVMNGHTDNLLTFEPTILPDVSEKRLDRYLKFFPTLSADGMSHRVPIVGELAQENLDEANELMELGNSRCIFRVVQESLAPVVETVEKSDVYATTTDLQEYEALAKDAFLNKGFTAQLFEFLNENIKIFNEEVESEAHTAVKMETILKAVEDLER